MIVDILIIFPILAFMALGLKDGMVRKGIALGVTLVALIVAHLMMNDMASWFAEEFDMEQGSALFYGYFSIFFGLILLQSLIFRLTAHDYTIGGIADRIVGSFLGFLQGMFIMSAIFMVLALQRIPTRTYRVDSRLYSSIVNLAPQFLDFMLTTVPVSADEIKEKTGQRLDELTKPETGAKKPTPTEKK